MKTKLLYLIAIVLFILKPSVFMGNGGPALGDAAGFVLFSTNGAVSNSGISQLTGNVGTNMGSSTAFGNVNGGMHDQDSVSAKCAADLLTAYNNIAAATATFSPSSTLLGNGDTLIAGVYSYGAAATLNGKLYLNAKGNANAVFIIRILGSLSMNPSSKVTLINGALACNVFWQIEGLVSMASGITMRGTVIANNGAINMATGDTLEGRALSTAGAVGVNGVFAYTPIGCGSPVLNGPVLPVLLSTACYGLFSTDGSVTNSGVTFVKGDVGTNVGSTTGFNSADVTGTIHPGPDLSTAQCAKDLDTVYKHLNNLKYDIELLYPAKFGSNLVLTPHTYIMKAAASLTDTVYLNALGNANAVFVIQVNGALTTSTYSKVLLINGALAENVFWKIEGAVTISDNSIFRGTLVCNNGAVGAFYTGVELDGRFLTTAGAITAAAITTTMTPVCLGDGLASFEKENSTEAVTVYPNPFNSSATIMLNEMNQVDRYEWRLYNVLGAEVMNTILTKQVSTFDTGLLPAGVYFYRVTGTDKTIQSGKLIRMM